jgi:3-dehydroquinate synthetase
VDTPAGKNLVGAFHWPALVVVDVALLSTLPITHWRAGFAEVLKHGAIASDEHFRRAAALGDKLPNVESNELVQLIGDSIRIKAQIVAADERESGPRRSLNVGHTLAHAFEQVSQFQLLHGEAVSIGLVLESEIGERIGVTAPGTAAQLRSALAGAGLPVTVPRHLIPVDVLAATRSDKKARDGRVEYSLLARLGAADEAQGKFSRAVRDSDVSDVLQTFSAG